MQEMLNFPVQIRILSFTAALCFTSLRQGQFATGRGRGVIGGGFWQSSRSLALQSVVRLLFTSSFIIWVREMSANAWKPRQAVILQIHELIKNLHV